MATVGVKGLSLCVVYSVENMHRLGWSLVSLLSYVKHSASDRRRVR